MSQKPGAITEFPEPPGATGASGPTGPPGPHTPVVELKIIDDNTLLASGDGQLIWCIPTLFNGMHLTSANAFVSTFSTSSLPSVALRNVTTGFDMLSTNITIDANEYTSFTAATPPVIDGAHSLVSTGDLIAVDVDASGTGTKGLGVIAGFA